MVSYPRTDLKIPLRPAPAPPSYRPTRFQQNTCALGSLDDRNDTFMNGNISKSSSNINSILTAKKKPPPRPPPPKVNNHGHANAKQNKSNILFRLFSKSNQGSNGPHSSCNKQISNKNHDVIVASLIDLDSPSSSPTFTTTSSSDGVSVHSFGSDCSVSNNGNIQSSGTASLFESVFEDDLDFFVGLLSNNIKTSNTIDQNDRWSVDSQASCSQPSQKTPLDAASNLGNAWSVNSTENIYTISNPTSTPVLKPPQVTSTMPTIIRPKPSRPLTSPKSLQTLQSNTEKNKPIGKKVVQFPASNQFHNVCDSKKLFAVNANDSSYQASPPMPTTPPPPPPLGFNSKTDIPIVLPDLPPRSALMDKRKSPHGIALYNYSTSHPDDLAFKANDVVHILRKINDEWLYGEIRSQQGMFPANFIEIIVPLEETSDNLTGHKTVIALFPFSAQQWEDLAFPEGAVIKVLGTINSDWLYGEYQGKLGQFPSSFVDHVPSGLPLCCV